MQRTLMMAAGALALAVSGGAFAAAPASDTGTAVGQPQLQPKTPDGKIEPAPNPAT